MRLSFRPSNPSSPELRYTSRHGMHANFRMRLPVFLCDIARTKLHRRISSSTTKTSSKRSNCISVTCKKKNKKNPRVAGSDDSVRIRAPDIVCQPQRVSGSRGSERGRVVGSCVYWGSVSNIWGVEMSCYRFLFQFSRLAFGRVLCV
jgi:hypothetical protein